MRKVVFIASFLAICATTAMAEVRLGTRKDGTKYIYNVGGSSRGGMRGTDYDWLAKQRNRSSEYDAIIEKYARHYGVDPILVKAVIQVESNFNPSTVSHKGARGLMQLIPATARRFNVDKIHDPEQNIRGGVAYLAFLLRNFSHDLPRVLAGYNAGENAVLRYGGIPPYEETQAYVKKVLTVYYGRPYGGASGAVYYAGNSKGKNLKGGFKQATRPVVVATATNPKTYVPGLIILNTR
jgi:hypothetical protein